MPFTEEEDAVIDRWAAKRKRNVKVSQILFAEPEGIDFIVKFDCGCVRTFEGCTNLGTSTHRDCERHAKLPKHSPILLRMYGDAAKQRDVAGMAYR
jgi:hypothetical protein